MKIDVPAGRASFILIAGLLLYSVLWSIYPHQFNASDPWAYSALADKLTRGLDFGTGSETFDYRVGVYVPVAVFYKLFGINIITTHVWSLCAALLIISTVWIALPDTRSKVVGLALCLMSVPLFEASVDLYPDFIAAAFMAASTLVLTLRNNNAERQTLWLLFPVLSVVLMFFAFLAKETAFWVIPVWVILFLSDAKREDFRLLWRRFYFPALLTGLLLGVLYLLVSWEVWGDPLARIKLIQSYTGRHLWSWTHASTRELIARLTIDPARMLFTQYKVVLVLAFFCFFILPTRLIPWAYYTASCLILFWFGTTSFTRYEPLPIVARMILPALPGFYVLAAYLTSRIRISSPRGPFKAQTIGVVLILSIALLPFLTYVRSWTRIDLGEANAMRIVRDEVEAHPQSTFLLICSDSRSPESLAFYFSYRYPKNLQAIAAADLGRTHTVAQKSFVFVDETRSNFLKILYDDKNYDTQIRSLGLTPLHKSDHVALYAIERPGQLDDLRSQVEKAR